MIADYKIDFVVTWVDSNDPQWQEEYSRYREFKPKEDASRFRDWDAFKFWFRAVEKYAPWVNKVYVITNGQSPSWLNLDNQKVRLVKHKDYIPEEYLPTFNSRCIELNLGRIEDLSEHFVYFNDDVYLNKAVSPDTFFTKGLPNDTTSESISSTTRYSPVDQFGIAVSNYCNIAVLNYHFDRREVVRQAPLKWVGPHLSLKHNIHSLLMWNHPFFHNFYVPHVEQAYLKSTFQHIWEHEPDFLNQSCTRFREQVSLTPYFARYWQLASNSFHPTKMNRSKVFYLDEKNLGDAIKALSSENFVSLCINDSPVCSEEFFKEASTALLDAFERKFPQKSTFEK